MHVAVTGASSGIGEAIAREYSRSRHDDTPMTQSGLDAYGRTGLVKLIPLGNAAALARGLRRAVERRRSRFIYPRFYALARWFPRLSAWLSTRLAPRLQRPNDDPRPIGARHETANGGLP